MTSIAMRVAVLGSTGFVGSAVCEALAERGANVVRVSAPRPDYSDSAQVRVAQLQLQEAIRGVDCVVNCAGNPDASSSDKRGLWDANARLPELVCCAAERETVRRIVHLSSAVVQGSLRLDESERYQVTTPYGRSKRDGERQVLACTVPQTVVYRPPSVHAPSRRVTRRLAKIARSRFAVVSAPGTAPTPQALIGNVADAVAFLALTDAQPPRVVGHPWEGLSTSELLHVLGGAPPRLLPRMPAAVVRRLASLGGHLPPPIGPNAKRLQLILFGQQQAQSWLTRAGWSAPAGLSAWQELTASPTHETLPSSGRGKS